MIGTRRDDTFDSNAGSAFIYELVEDTWIEVTKLYSMDLQAGDWFGEAVAIDGDVVVVGARAEDELGNNAGAAYVFERDAGGPDNWGETDKLLATDGVFGDLFGEAVAVEGDSIVVGAPNADNDEGDAYLFRRDGDEWTEVTSFKGEDTGGNDHFGTWISLDGGIALTGAPGDGTGSAYLTKFVCEADFNCDGNANILDFVAFQQAFQSFLNSADCDDNGIFNILDFVCFQQLFQEGC